MTNGEAKLLSGVIISLTVSAETIEDLLFALAWVSHPRYVDSARYWDQHLTKLRGGDHSMAIPFASFMSLAAAVLACDVEEYWPRDWFATEPRGRTGRDRADRAGCRRRRPICAHPAGLTGPFSRFRCATPTGTVARVGHTCLLDLLECHKCHRSREKQGFFRLDPRSARAKQQLAHLS